MFKDTGSQRHQFGVAQAPLAVDCAVFDVQLALRALQGHFQALDLVLLRLLEQQAQQGALFAPVDLEGRVHGLRLKVVDEFLAAQPAQEEALSADDLLLVLEVRELQAGQLLLRVGSAAGVNISYGYSLKVGLCLSSGGSCWLMMAGILD